MNNNSKDRGIPKVVSRELGNAKTTGSKSWLNPTINAIKGKTHMHGSSPMHNGPLDVTKGGPSKEGLGLSLHGAKKRARRDQIAPIATLVDNALEGKNTGHTRKLNVPNVAATQPLSHPNAEPCSAMHANPLEGQNEASQSASSSATATNQKMPHEVSRVDNDMEIVLETPLREHG